MRQNRCERRQAPVLAIIPARGGSKGIPRKNLQRLAGRPLLEHTVRAALAASTVTRVVVSTDDDEIAAVAKGCGAEVVWRPAAISGDSAPSEEALLHVLDYLRSQESYEPALVVFLQATSPLRSESDIDDAVKQLQAESADSLFSACRVHGFVWRCHGSQLQSISYDFRGRPRRQDIGADYLENGSIYIFRPSILRETGNRLGGRIAVYDMDPLHSLQVDEPGDIELMERIMMLPAREFVAPEIREIRLLALDFDGVLTDDRVMVGEGGTEAVLCHRGDGFGIQRLAATGVQVVVLSKETNVVVAARCNKLRIDCIQACDNKLEALQGLAAERNLAAAQIAFVGNDLNDLECVRWAGVGVAVADARPEIKAAADWVTRRAGGWGAVREVCDAILEQWENPQS